MTPEQRERKRLMDRLWRERNREHVREYQKQYEASRPKKPRPGRYRPVPKDETLEERKARRAQQQAGWLERVGQDPEALTKYRERRAARQRAYWSRLSPEERRARDEAFRERRDADPERYEAFRAARREWERRHRAIKREMRAAPAAPVGEVFRSKLYSNELYVAVTSQLGRLKPGDYRDDLAAEAILIMLDGETDPRLAVKQARRQLGLNDFKTISFDAPNQCGKTLHDYVAVEEPDYA